MPLYALAFALTSRAGASQRKRLIADVVLFVINYELTYLPVPPRRHSISNLRYFRRYPPVSAAPETPGRCPSSKNPCRIITAATWSTTRRCSCRGRPDS